MSTPRGTGHPLHDLISSSVPLNRVNLSNENLNHVQENNIDSTSMAGSCFVCGVVTEISQPLTLKEAETLGDLSSNHLATSSQFLCSKCSQSLKELTQLQRRVEQITQCLRALIKIQLRKRSDIQDTGIRTILL